MCLPLFIQLMVVYEEGLLVSEKSPSLKFALYFFSLLWKKKEGWMTVRAPTMVAPFLNA